MTAKRRILYPRLTQSQTRRTLSRNQAVHLRIKLLYSAMLSQLCQYMGVIRRSRRDESRRPNWLAQPIDYIGHRLYRPSLGRPYRWKNWLPRIGPPRLPIDLSVTFNSARVYAQLAKGHYVTERTRPTDLSVTIVLFVFLSLLLLFFPVLTIITAIIILLLSYFIYLFIYLLI